MFTSLYTRRIFTCSKVKKEMQLLHILKISSTIKRPAEVRRKRVKMSDCVQICLVLSVKV